MKSATESVDAVDSYISKQPVDCWLRSKVGHDALSPAESRSCFA